MTWARMGNTKWGIQALSWTKQHGQNSKRQHALADDDVMQGVGRLHIPLHGLEPNSVLGHKGNASDVLQATAGGVLAGVELKREGLVQPDQRQDRLLDGKPADSTAAVEEAEQHTGLRAKMLCKQGYGRISPAARNTRCLSPCRLAACGLICSQCCCGLTCSQCICEAPRQRVCRQRGVCWRARQGCQEGSAPA